jgi:hypothetical protein
MASSEPNSPQVQVEQQWRDAAAQIEVNATYTHVDGGADVIVTAFDETTGQVSWQRAAGPGPLDDQRTLFAVDFVTAYTRRG